VLDKKEIFLSSSHPFVEVATNADAAATATAVAEVVDQIFLTPFQIFLLQGDNAK